MAAWKLDFPDTRQSSNGHFYKFIMDRHALACPEPVEGLAMTNFLVIARPQAVAIQGGVDCRVAGAPRNDETGYYGLRPRNDETGYGLRPRNDETGYGLRPRNDETGHGLRPRGDGHVDL